MGPKRGLRGDYGRKGAERMLSKRVYPRLYKAAGSSSNPRKRGFLLRKGV